MTCKFGFGVLALLTVVACKPRNFNEGTSETASVAVPSGERKCGKLSVNTDSFVFTVKKTQRYTLVADGDAASANMLNFGRGRSMCITASFASNRVQIKGASQIEYETCGKLSKVVSKNGPQQYFIKVGSEKFELEAGDGASKQLVEDYVRNQQTVCIAADFEHLPAIVRSADRIRKAD